MESEANPVDLHVQTKTHSRGNTSEIARYMKGETTWSYQQLNTAVNRLARTPHRMDVEPGTWIGILLERSLFMVVALLGLLKVDTYSAGSDLPCRAHGINAERCGC